MKKTFIFLMALACLFTFTTPTSVFAQECQHTYSIININYTTEQTLDHFLGDWCEVAPDCYECTECIHYQDYATTFYRCTKCGAGYTTTTPDGSVYCDKIPPRGYAPAACPILGY